MRVPFSGRYAYARKTKRSCREQKVKRWNLSERQLLVSLISSSEAEGTGTGADCAERNEAIRSTSALPRLRRGLVRPEPRLSIPKETAIPLVWRRRIRCCCPGDFNLELDDRVVAVATVADRERIFSSLPVLTDLSQLRRTGKITRLSDDTHALESPYSDYRARNAPADFDTIKSLFNKRGKECQTEFNIQWYETTTERPKQIESLKF